MDLITKKKHHAHSCTILLPHDQLLFLNNIYVFIFGNMVQNTNCKVSRNDDSSLSFSRGYSENRQFETGVWKNRFDSVTWKARTFILRTLRNSSLHKIDF